VFELNGYEEERKILVVRKLEMHGNQKTTHGAERQVEGWKMSI